MKSLPIAIRAQGQKQNIAIQRQSGSTQSPNRPAVHVIRHQTQAAINTIAVLTPGLLQVASIPALALKPTMIEVHQEIRQQEVRQQEVRQERPGLHQSTKAIQQETIVAITGQRPAAAITNLRHHEKVITRAVPETEATVHQAAQKAIVHQAAQEAAPTKAIPLQEAVAPAEVTLHHHAVALAVALAVAPEVAHLAEDVKNESVLDSSTAKHP